MDFKEFEKMVRKVDQPRNFAVSHSWGIYDAYKKIRKDGWYDIGRPLKEKEFYSIVRGVNLLLADNLANGKTVVFPSRMGKLELRKYPVGVSIVNGHLKNTYPICWQDTLRLWFEDEEARKAKTLLRKDDQQERYHIRYNKFDANYENLSFYEFVLNRFIKIALDKNLKKGKIDTLW